VALDAHEQVVEVMGNPPGQGADRLHLLRLKKLGFQFLLFCDVSYEVERRRAPFPLDKDGMISTHNSSPDLFITLNE